MSFDPLSPRRTGRRSALKGALAGAAVLGGALVGATTARAGHDDPEGGEAVVGSWFALVNPPSGPVGALITFNADGTLTQTSTVPDSGPGHGAWQRVDDRQYLFIIRWFTFGPDGTANGSGKSRARIQVNEDRTAYSGQAHVERLDLAGAVVEERDAPAQAMRIVVEPLP
jgi:hypothetical protein